jgi:hypothetical protein
MSNKGLDIGTMNIVSAKKLGDSVETKLIRNVFVDVEPDALGLLSLSNVSYFQKDGSLFVLGEDAFKLANLFKRESRRPLAKGLISPSEVDSIDILYRLIEAVLGKPDKPNELCCFSVPAQPLDSERDVIYHQAVFSKIISSLGYIPKAVNEAYAIIFSECTKYNFSGLTFSWGSGLTNCALSYKSLPILQWSNSRGGDWIDSCAATSVGKTATQMCAIKEKGFDLLSPKDRYEEAISVYYKSLIKYSLDSFVKEFQRTESGANLDEELPLIISGGTSLATGFVDLVKIAFEENYKKFPIKIKTIIHAPEPLLSVAKGLLVYALNEESRQQAG